MTSGQEVFKSFYADYMENLPELIPSLYHPTAIDFLTNHVHPNCPAIIRQPGGFFPEAQKLWLKTDKLSETMMGRSITVDATPDGRADTIVGDQFILPEKRSMVFNEYMRFYENPPGLRPWTVYLNVPKKKNNLFDEFSPLLPLLSKDVPWATEAFGKPPEAANFWMGDRNISTLMHKDHYENIYFTITGSQTFKIYPPISIAWMPYRKYPKFQWYCEKIHINWRKKDLNEEVTLIRKDLLCDTFQLWKIMIWTKCYAVSILPGEALYLPPMWFHEVSQIDQTIALNYCYDVTYPVRSSYFRLLEALSKLPVPQKDASIDIQYELEEELANVIEPRITPKHLVNPPWMR